MKLGKQNMQARSVATALIGKIISYDIASRKIVGKNIRSVMEHNQN